MRLNNAIVCLDCEEIFEPPIRRCPHCGSDQFKPLGAWIMPMSLADRPEKAATLEQARPA